MLDFLSVECVSVMASLYLEAGDGPFGCNSASLAKFLWKVNQAKGMHTVCWNFPKQPRQRGHQYPILRIPTCNREETKENQSYGKLSRLYKKPERSQRNINPTHA